MEQEYLSKVDENIAKYGFHITFVTGDNIGPSFCYSTGLYKSFGIPEIFISALPQNLSFDLVGDYAQKFKTEDIPINQLVDFLTEKFPVLFIKVENEKLNEYVYSSIRYYQNDEYKYLQLIYPDTKGLFPNEIGYNYDQEIFGEINIQTK